MAYIFIRGKDDAVEVENASAKQIKPIWEHARLTRKHVPVEIGLFSTMTDEIKGIQLDNETSLDKTQDKQKEEWKKEVISFLKLSPETKAEKSFDYFLLALYVFTGQKEVDEKQKKNVLSLMTKFFEKNPKWAAPSLRLFKNIFEKIGLSEKQQDGTLNYWIPLCLLKTLELSESREVYYNGAPVL